jgi:hypothetical protein
VNPVLVNLIRNLAPGQSPVLRIGGDSTDWTWWPVPGLHRPAGIRYSLSPTWIGATKALAHATHARLILGINLEADSTRIAVAEAHALASGLGRGSGLTFEIGNEPELYAGRDWYHPRGGQAVPGRPRSYDFDAFLSEFTRFRKALPHLPIAGPAIGDLSWLQQLPQFLDAQPKLGLVTFHRYGLNKCIATPSSPHYPTVPNLLAPFASRGLMDGIGPYIAVAHQHGDPFRIDEMNAITCGGKLGVSNTFSAALWALDTLFTMAGEGVDGVNIHTFPRGFNELFDFARRHGKWTATTVRPEYYGLWMFAQAAPAGAQLMRTAGLPPDGSLRAWATRAPDGRTRVVLINDSLTQPYSVLVQASPQSGPASVERLEAPSAYATSGVTIGGRSFGSQTTSGTLGPPHATSSEPVAGGYRIAVPAAGAVLVTVPPTPLTSSTL